MLIWLLKWRQIVWLVLLVRLVQRSGLTVEVAAEPERLAAWWLATEQQSGHRQGSGEWVQRRMRVPLWVAQGWAWSEIGGWVGVTGGLGWLIWTEGGSGWSWGMLTLASHQVRTALHQVADLRSWKRGRWVA